MLDKNDRKYILRRIITYIAIAMIMLLFNCIKTKALTNSVALNTGGSTNAITSSDGVFTHYTSLAITQFDGYKNGSLYFSLAIGGQFEIYSISIYKNATQKMYSCDIGTAQGYSDSNTQRITYSAVCPIDFLDGNTSSSIVVRGYKHSPSNPIYITYGQYISYYSYDTDSSIIQAIQNSNSSSAINNMNNNITNQTNIQHQDAQQQHQDLQDINNTMKDDTPPSQNEVSGNTTDWSNNNAQSGVINQLVLMPVTLLQSFLNGINGTCQTYDFGELWGSHITLPCINLSSTLGSVWTIVDIIMSGIFIFIFGKKCVKIFNDFTNLKSGQIDSLYGGGE